MPAIRHVFTRFRIWRGMASYALLWPTGSLIQQTIEGKRFPNYDYWRCFRFALFGSCFIGPTMYIWMRFANKIFPQKDVKTSMKKALLEQVVYDPWAISFFLFAMSLMEGKHLDEATAEIREKFFDTYKVGVIYWPIVQTVNFAFIKPRNQVIFVSFFSMLWSSFLAYMKHLDVERIQQKRIEKKRARELAKSPPKQ